MNEEKKCPLQNKVCHTNHRPACTSIKEDTYIWITSFSVRADDIVQSRWTWPRPQFFIFYFLAIGDGSTVATRILPLGGQQAKGTPVSRIHVCLVASLS